MIREIQYNEVFDSQRHFRKILDSMARPGKINNLADIDINTPAKLNKASALLGFALMNADISFCAIQNEDEINEYFRVNTASNPANLNDADFVFVPGNTAIGVFEEIKTGEPEFPENNATVVIDVEKIGLEPIAHSCRLILKGPGVKSENMVYLKGISNEILSDIKDINSEYPLGIDVILSDKEGNIMCIPRTTRFSWWN